MRKTKCLFTVLLTLMAFLVIGAGSVNAETVSIVNNLEEFTSSINDNVDVIKLNANITASDTLRWGINADKTLDLNGFSINSSQNIMFKLFYYGDYTVKVINSSSSATGKINHTYTADDGYTFYLDNAVSGKNKTLYIDGVELNESGRARTIHCFDNNSTDNLIVKNVSSKSFEFSGGFDHYEFSNTVVRPIGVVSRVMLVSGNQTITVKDILADNQEIYYQAFDRVGGSMISSGVAEGDLHVADLWTNNTSDEQDNAITVRYKSGFTVSDVALTETYGYTATAQEISIKNRGTSDLQIKDVSVDSDNFEIVNGSQTTLSAGAIDTTWKIKPNAGLSKATYTGTITVTDMSDNTYTANVTLEVTPKELTGLGIDGINSTITYGEVYTPKLAGTTELGEEDYEIKYAQKDGESYSDIANKPTDVGEYKVTITVANENYTAFDASVFFKIVAKTIELTVEEVSDQEYTGGQITPELSVTYESIAFEKERDYTLEYGENKNVGTGKVTIKPVDGCNYTWTNKEVEFNIVAKSLADSNVTLNKTSYRHTGTEVKPEPVVKDGEKILVEGTDYELSYENNTAISAEAKVKVTGKGNYKGEITKTFSIVDKETQEINFTESEVTKTYGDDKFTITVNHIKGDGTVKYTSNNTSVAEVNETTGELTIKSAGTAEITATAGETIDYAAGASATYTLNVQKKKITFNVTLNLQKEYDGKTDIDPTSDEIKVSLIGCVSGDLLEFSIESAKYDRRDIGNSSVNVTVKLNGETDKKYELKANTCTISYVEIIPKTLPESAVTLNTTSYTYTGDEIKPTVTVKDEFLTGESGENLTEGTDYTVEYENNINAGTGKIRITAIRNFTGTVEKEFTINKKEITPTLEDVSDVTYNESEHTPEPVVRNGSTKLLKGVDYIVEYRNNINAGTAWIEVSPVASSNYTFATVNKSFKIAQYVIQETDVTLEYESTTFNNTAKEPSVTVKMGTELIEPTEYDVTYSDNTNAGTAKVTVMIKYDSVNYTGTIVKNFEIVAKTQLTISGISYQEVVYTGKSVKLVGNLTVSNGIDPSALTTKWYRDGTDLGAEPINTGLYKVVYSYEDDTYIGSLEVNFKIISATPKITLGNLYQYVGNVTKVTYTLEPNYSLADIHVYYKVEGADDSTYTMDLPTEKGIYTVKAELVGGFINLNYAEQTATLIIAKKSTGGGTSSSVKTYKITVKENENATITPNGTVKVERGDNQTFKIKTKDGYKIEDVLVDNESVGAVSKYTFEKVREDHTLEVKVSKVEETTYVDVSENSWYKEAVNYVTKKGLMNGTGNGEFSPNVTTTRGMIVTILYRLEKSPETKKATFTDVKATDYFAKAVAWAEENEIVNGYGERKFGPNDAITREQLAVILYRYSNYKKYDVSIGENTNILSYNDVSDLDEYAIPAMQWACGEELIKGMDNGMLSPRESATRAQVATILMRFCERYVK